MALLALQDLVQAKVALLPGSFLAPQARLGLLVGSPRMFVLPSLTAFIGVYGHCLFSRLPPLTPVSVLALNRAQHGDPHRADDQKC